MPTEQLEARVTLIHKKGKTDQYENYRPISLLNTLYQIFAALIQKRLAKGTDKLQTQYGFRKDRSTSDTIYVVRGIAEYGEKTKNKFRLVLLDQESI
jgi:hypothetical protein